MLSPMPAQDSDSRADCIDSFTLDGKKSSPIVNGLNVDERYALVRSIGEECVQDDELRRLLQSSRTDLTAYDGFEPSGRMHIAQGILKAINVNKLTRSGFSFKFWVADLFAKLNMKMGGDLERIRTVGEYLIEVWKAAGMDMDRVEFIWASERIGADPDRYWALVMDIATRFNLSRMKRCCTIMGRDDSDDMLASQILYPCMQAADIFYLNVDVCQLGLDQRKVNMLARDYASLPDVKKKFKKPIILSHPMMMGLKQGQAKMSKSDPDSAIFMEDTEEDVNRKIKKAYCPPMIVEDNPCLDYIKHLIFPKYGFFDMKRPEKYGGDKLYRTFEEIVADYVSDQLNPGDVKDNLKRLLNEMIEPVREHFRSDPKAKALLDRVRHITKAK